MNIANINYRRLKNCCDKNIIAKPLKMYPMNDEVFKKIPYIFQV